MALGETFPQHGMVNNTFQSYFGVFIDFFLYSYSTVTINRGQKLKIMPKSPLLVRSGPLVKLVRQQVWAQNFVTRFNVNVSSWKTKFGGKSCLNCRAIIHRQPSDTPMCRRKLIFLFHSLQKWIFVSLRNYHLLHSLYHVFLSLFSFHFCFENLITFSYFIFARNFCNINLSWIGGGHLW